MGQTLIALVCLGIFANLGWAKAKGKVEKEALTFDGKKRTYYLFAPPGLTAPAPLLLLLHGSGHDGTSLIDPWKSLAEKEGLILVAPDSYNSMVWDQRVDGPDFLHAVISEVQAKKQVDARRVYLFGHSGGAMYALYLSIIESQYFAATAIHAGALLESNFKLIPFAKRKIPIAIWVGTIDASFPMEQVKATADAFRAHGFAVEVHSMPGHDHNYYTVAADVNGAAWKMLSENKLDQEPNFQVLSKGTDQLQTAPSPSNANNEADLSLTPEGVDASIWAAAKPYVDDPLEQITASIHELRGLQPTDDQQTLPEILKKTADKTVDLLAKMPNVISQESVSTKVEPRGPTWHQEFEYLVLRHETKGEVTLDEYRTSKDKTVGTPLSQGSVNAWVLFHPGNMEESRFRFFGRQSVDGHATLVVGFVQIPEKVKFPGHVNFLNSSIPVLFQGIAWIDESDFRIVRLRTDLLAPRPDIYLRSLTSEVRFAEVHVFINDSPVWLWLPRESTVTWDFKGQTVEQFHKYSTFKVYHTKTRLIM
jgi:predicted esterase